jgi:microcystin-dependent protein
MTAPMLGQISLFPYEFAPSGWKFCDGSQLPMSENLELYELLQDTFGGGGGYFGVPDLREFAPANCHYCIKVTGDFPFGSYPGVSGETFLAPLSPTPPNVKECAGQSLTKGKYTHLDEYMGTRFGGGTNTINMPNLRNKNPSGLHYAMIVEGYNPRTRSSRDTYLGELLLLPFELSNADHLALCDGREYFAQLSPALYDLLGNRFGGQQGQFALPDLRNAVPEKFNYYINIEGATPPK